MGNKRLWAAMEQRNHIYEKAEMTNEDGTKLGEHFPAPAALLTNLVSKRAYPRQSHFHVAPGSSLISAASSCMFRSSLV